MTSLQDELNKAIELAAKVYDSKFIEEGNFINSFHCAESFKSGAEMLMPVIELLIRQRNYYARNNTTMDFNKAVDFFNSLDQEILDLIEGSNG
jgi:hypothetical protein